MSGWLAGGEWITQLPPLVSRVQKVVLANFPDDVPAAAFPGGAKMIFWDAEGITTLTQGIAL